MKQLIVFVISMCSITAFGQAKSSGVVGIRLEPKPVVPYSDRTMVVRNGDVFTYRINIVDQEYLDYIQKKSPGARASRVLVNPTYADSLQAARSAKIVDEEIQAFYNRLTARLDSFHFQKTFKRE